MALGATAVAGAIDRTKRIWEIYDNVAAEAGFTGGPDYHGMLKQIHVAETEEKALKNAAQFRWMQGEFTGLAHPVWSTPSGYGSPENRRAFVEFASGRSRNPGARKTAGRSDDHRRYTKAGDRQIADSARRDAARHSRHLGE